MIFVYLVPCLFRIATGLPVETPSPVLYAVFSFFFIGIGIAERYAIYPLKLPIRLLNILLGIAIVVAILGSGCIVQTIPSGGVYTTIEIDFYALMYTVIIGLILLSVISLPKDEE